MEFALIRNSYKSFAATPVFARINPYTKEDLYHNNIRYMIFDVAAKKFQWICSTTNELKIDDTGALYCPNAMLVCDAHLPDEFPWKISKDIAHGVHFNSVIGDVFDGFFVKNDDDYKNLLELTASIPANTLAKCHKIVTENLFPEWHSICNWDDARNLFFPTRNLSCSSFTDVNIGEENITVKLSSTQWDCNVEIVFEDDTVYLVNNENIDSIDDIKPSTKYFCGNKVSYKITPYF